MCADKNDLKASGGYWLGVSTETGIDDENACCSRVLYWGIGCPCIGSCVYVTLTAAGFD